MSGHLVVNDLTLWRSVLREARSQISKEFHIDHITIQIEDEAMRQEEATIHG
jgi:cobalt-zinc-cadmium efflux system protein